jgi:hypothetical protein
MYYSSDTFLGHFGGTWGKNWGKHGVNFGAFGAFTPEPLLHISLPIAVLIAMKALEDRTEDFTPGKRDGYSNFSPESGQGFSTDQKLQWSSAIGVQPCR